MVINAGLNIKIEGTKNYLSGTGATVVAQSPAAGTKVAPGEVVTVTFRYMEDEEIAPGV
jgi:beta-lactam-binding protein with PASTA domain